METIKVCSFDKGHGTVLLNTDDYFAKLDRIVLSEKFEEVSVPDDVEHHPVCKAEKSIQYYVNRYVKPHVTKDVYTSIYPSGGQPGAVYGLIKVHKDGYPARPVVSMVGTRNTDWQSFWTQL